MVVTSSPQVPELFPVSMPGAVLLLCVTKQSHHAPLQPECDVTIALCLPQTVRKTMRIPWLLRVTQVYSGCSHHMGVLGGHWALKACASITFMALGSGLQPRGVWLHTQCLQGVSTCLQMSLFEDDCTQLIEDCNMLLTVKLITLRLCCLNDTPQTGLGTVKK